MKFSKHVNRSGSCDYAQDDGLKKIMQSSHLMLYEVVPIQEKPILRHIACSRNPKKLKIERIDFFMCADGERVNLPRKMKAAF
jgi:hypothetical protein